MRCTRRGFLLYSSATVGLGALAGAAPGCGGGVAGRVTLKGGQAVLPFADFPELSRVGGGVVVDTDVHRPLAVIRLAQDRVIALTAVCTHAACTVAYSEDARDLECPCHGSRFTSSGAVARGPADSPLTEYPATLGPTGVTVTRG